MALPHGRLQSKRRSPGLGLGLTTERSPHTLGVLAARRRLVAFLPIIVGLPLAFSAVARAQSEPVPPTPDPAAASAQAAPPTTEPSPHASTAPLSPQEPAARAATVPASTTATPPRATQAPAVTPAPPARVAPALPQPPATLNDLAGWLDYKTRSHIASLPQEARLFYRRGLMAHQSGSREEGIRLVRGSADLDPSFVAPHLRLASWFILGEPSQALQQYAEVLEMARQNFVLQLALSANALYLGLQALFLGLLAAGFLIVFIRNRELRHEWHERLGRFLTPGTARWWSWAFLVLPFFTGLGLALPTVVFLGLLWVSLSVRERVVFVLLVASLVGAPWITASLDRMSTPLRDDRGPLFGVALVEGEPYSATRQEHFGQLAAQHPDNPYLQFGLAWVARRGADLATAEASYRRALQLWPNDDRVLNNLGNTLAIAGRQDEALECYRKATDANPLNAAAWFNSSQLYTQRYEYRPATDALARASAINFDMVRTYQTESGSDGVIPLVDQWLAPKTLWNALRTAELPGSPTLPPAWRQRLEFSGLSYSIVVALLAAFALALGIGLQKSVALRSCSNCGRIVCRRCAHRRRELALCPECVSVESRAESPEFARVLLNQHARSVRASQNMVRTALAALIPGFGLLSFQRLLSPLFLLTATAALVGRWFGLGAPFTFEPRLAIGEGDVPVPVLVALWILIYAISLGGYFAHVSRQRAQAANLAAPVRSRTTQATRRSTAQAA